MFRTAVFVLIVCTYFGVVYGQGSAPLKLVQTIPLPGVEGRIDHLAADIKGQRLFVAALGNNTLEIIDIAQFKRVHTITGLREPQGVRFAPEVNRIFVANGSDGTARAYDASTFAMISSLNLGDDADNVRYDPVTAQILVGYGGGALAILDAKTMKSTGSIKLSGHPESFQLETSSPKVFANVPTANHIA